MGFERLVNQAVRTAKRLTLSLQVSVTLVGARTVVGDGTVTTSTRTTRQAVVEYRSKRLVVEGVEVVATAKVTFLEDVTVGTADRIALPDGDERAVLAVQKLLAPGGGGYLTEVWLGA